MSGPWYRVGEAARIGRVSVRTLHHYDAIGLLRAASRSNGQYRLYSRADLERLHHIRLYRMLGLSLEEIQRVLDDPAFDPREALRMHKERLTAEIEESRALVDTIDRMLRGSDGVSAEELFDGFQSEAYAHEARERWGDTESWRESNARVGTYDERTLATIRAEHEQLLDDFAAALQAGREPSSTEAMELAERARLHIDRWFYPLSRDAHVSLSELYLADPRFNETYERVAGGLAAFVVESIAANATRG